MVELMTSAGASESVIVTPGPATGRQPGGLLAALDPSLEPAYLAVADPVGQPLHVAGQVAATRSLELLVLPVLGLARGEARSV